MEDADAALERANFWPFGKFPVLTDDGKTVIESTIIIEHLDIHHAGPTRLIPEDRGAALYFRFMDRFFNLPVMAEMQKPVFAAMSGDGARKDEALAAAISLETAYAWLEGRFSDGRR